MGQFEDMFKGRKIIIVEHIDYELSKDCKELIIKSSTNGIRKESILSMDYDKKKDNFIVKTESGEYEVEGHKASKGKIISNFTYPHYSDFTWGDDDRFKDEYYGVER